jgi:TMEM175 potassium channel family protein
MTEGGDGNRAANEALDERLLNRLIFFTDAVFAIVLTLMVLDLKPPAFDRPLGNAAAMRSMASHFFALAMSFVVISIFWMAHLTTTRQMRRFDWPSAVANLAFLFPVCLLPFATAWWGRDLASPFPWGMYCGTMVFTSLANVALVLVVSRDGGRLVGGITPRERLYRSARAASPGVSFALGIVVMAAGFLTVAQFCWLLIPIFLMLSRVLLRPRIERPAA